MQHFEVMKIVKGLAAGAGAATVSYATYVATTWLRFGHAKRVGDALLDELMPDYDVCERHELALASPADATFAAAKAMDFASVHAFMETKQLRTLKHHAEHLHDATVIHP